MKQYLSREQQHSLESLKFVSDSVRSKALPMELYDYNNEIWAVGGGGPRFKKWHLLAPPEVYEKGKRLITVDDLIEWLEHRLMFELRKEEGQWRGALFAAPDEERMEFEDDLLIEVLYKMVCRALELQPSLLDVELPLVVTLEDEE